jgi:hypothetical protein
VAVRDAVDFDPLGDSLPLQLPEALQAVAFADAHARVEEAPLLTVLGFADRVTVGAAFITETVAVCVALPPGPVHVSPKVSFSLIAPVDCEPLAPLAPDQAPDAAQEVAFVADQVRMDALPLATVLGVAAKVTAGACCVTETVVDWCALPPCPVHVSSYAALLLSGPVPSVPVAALLPDQSPEATHSVALVEDQLTVEPLPLNTVVGLADKRTVGAGEATDTVVD